MNLRFKACLFSWLSFCVFSFGQVSTLYVDFGSSGAMTASPSMFGHAWNNVTENTPTGLTNLVSDSGQLTGIALGLSGPVAVNPTGTTVPNVATLGGLAVESATKDWFFLSGDQVLTVTLSNLAPDGIFRLSLFGSRDWAGAVGSDDEIRVTRYDVSGMTTDSKLLTTSALGIGLNPQPNANRSNLALFENVRASVDGTLVINVKRNRGMFGYLGALRLETMNVVNSPPAAVGVAVSGAPRVGSTVSGRYTYFDLENDPVAGTQFFWERAITTTATPTRISDPSTALRSFTPALTEQGYYIRMGVIPKASSGRTQGAVSYSRWMGPVVPTTTLTSFHIGSSFTLWPDIPRQLKELGQASNKFIAPQVQLTSGRDLSFHWENGLDGGGYGSGVPSREDLVTGTYDVLVLQPFNWEWQPWAIGGMREYTNRFYSLAAPSGTQVYLYCAWPWHSMSVSTQTEINAAFEQVRSSISTVGNKPALIIPAGQALRAVIEACGSGALTGYTRENFYRYREDPADNLHLSHLGSYVSALTHYATIFKTSPVGLPARGLDAGFHNDNLVTFDSAVALRIQQIVWDVVRAYPHSGLGATSFSNPPPVVIPPPVVELDPPFVTESIVPSDPQLLHYAFGTGAIGSDPVMVNMPRPIAPTALGMISFEYTLNPSAEGNGVIYTPHWSYDLRRWTSTQPLNTVTTRTNNTVRISWPNTSRWRFLRIHVFKP